MILNGSCSAAAHCQVSFTAIEDAIIVSSETWECLIWPKISALESAGDVYQIQPLDLRSFKKCIKGIYGLKGTGISTCEENCS